MKLFIVSVEVKTVVYAEDKQQARELAGFALEDELNTTYGEGEFVINEFDGRLPPGWDENCYPYTDFEHKNMTIRMIFEKGKLDELAI